MIIKVFSKLFDVLIHVRGKHIALTGDIENAFLMIGIHESDRDMLRFLWINDPQWDFRTSICSFSFWSKPSPAISTHNKANIRN